jgi:hypothetical protein
MQLEPLIVKDDGRDRGYPGGLSLGDVDGDGDLDLLATRGYDPTAKSYKGDRSLLYLNDGHGKFARQENPWSDEEAPDSGATLADVDGDGDLDAYVNAQLKKPNRYFRNEGGGRFVATELGEATQDKSSNFSSSFADIDVDGDLDLYVSGPTLELSDVNLVFRNDGGRFVAVTGTPIDNGKNNPAAAVWGDVDNDGDVDLLVANSDVMRSSKLPPPPIEHSMLFRNDRNWIFSVDQDQAFANQAYPAISAALGDVDNDGDLDLFLGSHVYQVDPRPDWLFVNDGKGRFALAPQTFPTHAETATGAAFADFNGDGNLDLLAISYQGPVEVFTGDGTGKFKLVEDRALAEVRKGRWAAVTGDIDGDGRIDALLGRWGETAQGDYITIMRNRTPRCGSWTELIVKDRAGAPNPPGTRITLTSVAGKQTLKQLRESNAQTGFRSQSASTFLFAIPPGHRVRDAEVRWPDGSVQRLDRIEADKRRTVQAPTAAPEIHTEDVTRFYRIYDAADGHPTAEQLQRDYLDAGSEGLHQLAKLRNVTGVRIAETLAKSPQLYVEARRCMAVLPGVRQRVDVALRTLVRLYPQARTPPVTIVVSRGKPVGVGSPVTGLQIGLEALCSAEWMNPNVEDRFVHVIAHEYAHVQQAVALVDNEQPTVLERSLIEGAAEFVAELTSGKTGYQHFAALTQGRERELETAFAADIDQTELARWVDNSTMEQGGDIGYWIGYRIVKAYYRRATDKQQALREILQLSQPKAFLEKSGWRPGMRLD